MSIGLFRRSYVILRHGVQTEERGYSVSDGVYLTVRLNVQPLGSDELSALPEGERTIARVKTFGDTEMISADEHSGITGDLLLYSGKWYECKSCVHWLHTPLTHYEAEWVIRANNEQSDQLTVNSEQFCSC